MKAEIVWGWPMSMLMSWGNWPVMVVSRCRVLHTVEGSSSMAFAGLPRPRGDDEGGLPDDEGLPEALEGGGSMRQPALDRPKERVVISPAWLPVSKPRALTAPPVGRGKGVL